MFVPHPSNPAAALDQAMREDLAASLGRIGTMAGAQLPDLDALAGALEHIRRHRVEPGVFAAYYDLVFALQRRDVEAAGKLWSGVLTRAAADEFRPRLMRYRVADLGDDAERFQRLAAMGMAAPMVFAEPSGADWRRFQTAAPAAIELLARANPAWAEELGALVGWTIAAAPGDQGVGFSGGSSMMIWGAVLVNARDSTDRIGVLGVLVHEATHLLLLGLSRSEPLVLNPVGQRFRTEARPTLRPMNALYHSTYVSGRVARLCQEILERCSGELAPAERDNLEQSAAMQRDRFDQGWEVIRDHAQMTPLGQRLIEEAHAVLAQA